MKMEEQYQSELSKIIKKERLQKRITKYVSTIASLNTSLVFNNYHPACSACLRKLD